MFLINLNNNNSGPYHHIIITITTCTSWPWMFHTRQTTSAEISPHKIYSVWKSREMFVWKLYSDTIIRCVVNNHVYLNDYKSYVYLHRICSVRAANAILRFRIARFRPKQKKKNWHLHSDIGYIICKYIQTYICF